ncbi:hypothetical protein [Streptomyces sennicomposti]|uniref:hypothetical protein n=1 Tax=Streptomyces sennicomposti TaxID=2873384 RepID=UPI001CA76C76|nr:hypothetical protein [Streptomyces sennicomposti]MBY8865413.1 hypothetical protein [Streptomyces sennicomposti]
MKSPAHHRSRTVRIRARRGRAVALVASAVAPTGACAADGARGEWEVACGDREGPVRRPGRQPLHRPPHPGGRGADGLVLWRFDDVRPDNVDGYDDDIEGCEE